MTSPWHSATVISGSRLGSEIGYPTANFDAKTLAHIKQEGVYAARVKVEGQIFHGALYLGPRLVLGESQRVLEIFLLDFDGNLYNQTIQFQLGAFIRPPMDFDTFDTMIDQLELDVAAIRGESVS